jgi:hypothetical protein
VFPRILGVLIMVIALAGAATNLAYAGERNSDNQCARDQDGPSATSSAPELDPSYLGGGILLLIGGVLLLNESKRRRN